jgi:hypothetical protein
MMNHHSLLRVNQDIQFKTINPYLTGAGEPFERIFRCEPPCPSVTMNHASGMTICRHLGGTIGLMDERCKGAFSIFDLIFAK